MTIETVRAALQHIKSLLCELNIARTVGEEIISFLTVVEHVDAYCLSYGGMHGYDQIFLIRSLDELRQHFRKQHAKSLKEMDYDGSDFFSVTLQCVKNNRVVSNAQLFDFLHLTYTPGTFEYELRGMKSKQLNSTFQKLPKIQRHLSQKEFDQYTIREYWNESCFLETGECAFCGDETCDTRECTELRFKNGKWVDEPEYY